MFLADDVKYSRGDKVKNKKMMLIVCILVCVVLIMSVIALAVSVTLKPTENVDSF